jgi:hypothetical protein
MQEVEVVVVDEKVKVGWWQQLGDVRVCVADDCASLGVMQK